MRKFILSLLLIAGPAHAEFYSGNELYEKMRSRDSIERLEAMMYIAGVSDAHRGVVSCPSPEVSLGQLFDMVKNYLERNPDRRHRTGDWVVAAVMRAAFPCRTGAGT